jgi:hypothetical protein
MTINKNIQLLFLIQIGKYENILFENLCLFLVLVIIADSSVRLNRPGKKKPEWQWLEQAQTGINPK